MLVYTYGHRLEPDVLQTPLRQAHVPNGKIVVVSRYRRIGPSNLGVMPNGTVGRAVMTLAQIGEHVGNESDP